MEKNPKEQDHPDIVMSSCINKDDDEEEEDVALPGFRFHPTDEELVSFYLRRKVEDKPLSIELIKQVDIYKFDPWDLPKTSNGGDKEGYYFCKRGRKYRNSIRPNRVTGSGFWKATGIDKPVHSTSGECIGLKKTLVYYRGSAGKGTKTNWMMHEFRLPTNDNTTTVNTDNNNIADATKSSTQEAEVWTLCRIFQRNTSYRKYTADWREQSNKRQSNDAGSSMNTCNTDHEDSNCTQETYLCFSAPAILQQTDWKKPIVNDPCEARQAHVDQWGIINSQPSSSMVSSSNVPINSYGNDLFADADWDELRSVVDFAFPHYKHM